jgi:hypothetical protein
LVHPVIADNDGDGGYDISTKIGMLLLKKEINKPLRRIDDDVYNQRSMSETVFSMLKNEGEQAASYNN